MNKSVSFIFIRCGLALVFVSFTFIPEGVLIGNVLAWKACFYIGAILTAAGIALWAKERKSVPKTHALKAE